ncbi:MAG: hypothetical protein UX44_C0014G0010 [candidate division WWE3 bacterium GW2011_GWA1_46_21]|uniref:Uncharacterized protein n=4 Tax=Katanobacteria TaxID=422282 RepID=A0A0G1SBU7_UNCKA|nr:MAG: hypothetical protein UX44_C0014G0010 [candidate division WWE3 bacterium GW2011_GWA1_46_21]KKU49370.1 MAG: hypothetical protein UX69_C0003G0022 [candidate division WWE3 bacterium GW2011_GWA2_46_9]KKU51270.1 MAG: hypothetical protein UX73_C0004G0016 [candidate division WWE3 bacterium GW2011_GWC1_47_10]KKU57939.1 MAG: hypothetical protein UX79_C0003G0009 [candidate division WWE3 bacterium GW2011_GWB1_47_11]
MIYNEIVKTIGQPLLIKSYDTVVVREFQSIEQIKAAAHLAIHWNVGFLIEQTNTLIKFGAEYVSGLWSYPIVWPKSNVAEAR